jgi:hypothetical protein
MEFCAKCDALVDKDARNCSCHFPQFATRECKHCHHINEKRMMMIVFNPVCVICNTSLLDSPTVVAKRMIRSAFVAPLIHTGAALDAIEGYPSYKGLDEASHTLTTIDRDSEEYGSVEEKFLASINGHNSVTCHLQIHPR